MRCAFSRRQGTRNPEKVNASGVSGKPAHEFGIVDDSRVISDASSVVHVSDVIASDRSKPLDERDNDFVVSIRAKKPCRRSYLSSTTGGKSTFGTLFMYLAIGIEWWSRVNPSMLPSML